jgi:hypothetical protein
VEQISYFIKINRNALKHVQDKVLLYTNILTLGHTEEVEKIFVGLRQREAALVSTLCSLLTYRYYITQSTEGK